MTLKKVLLSLIILILLGKELNSAPGRTTISSDELIGQALGTATKKTLIFAGLNNLKLLSKNLEIHAQNIGVPLQFNKIKKLSDINNQLFLLNNLFLNKFWVENRQLDPFIEFDGSIVKRTYFDIPNSDVLSCFQNLTQANTSFLLNPPTNLIAANIILHELLYLFWDSARLHQKLLKALGTRNPNAKLLWFSKYFPGFNPQIMDYSEFDSGFSSTIKTRHRKSPHYFLVSPAQTEAFTQAIGNLISNLPLIGPMQRPLKNPMVAPLPIQKPDQKKPKYTRLPDQRDENSGFGPWFFAGRKAPKKSQAPIYAPIAINTKVPQDRPLTARPAKIAISGWPSDHKCVFATLQTSSDEISICSFNIYATHAFESDLETMLWANNNQALDPKKEPCQTVCSNLAREKNQQTKLCLESITQKEPDLLLFQEIQQGLETIFTPNGYQPIQFILSAKPNQKTGTPGHGLALYIKAGSGITVEMQTASSKGQALPRHQICVIKKNHRPAFILFNVHLAMLEIDALITDIKNYQASTGLPFVAIGDFNLDCGPTAPKNHKDTLERLKKETTGQIERTSETVSCVSSAGKKELLDHCLFSRGVTLTSFSMIGNPEAFWQHIYMELSRRLGQNFWLKCPQSEDYCLLMHKFLLPYSRFENKKKLCCSLQNPKKGCPYGNLLTNGNVNTTPFDRAQICQRPLKSGKGLARGGFHLKISQFPEYICNRDWCKWHRGDAHLKRLNGNVEKQVQSPLALIPPVYPPAPIGSAQRLTHFSGPNFRSTDQIKEPVFGGRSINPTRLPDLEVLSMIADNGFHDHSFPAENQKYHIYNKQSFTPRGGLPVICVFGTETKGGHTGAWQANYFAWLSNYFVDQKHPIFLGGKQCSHGEAIYGALTVLASAESTKTPLPDLKFIFDPDPNQSKKAKQVILENQSLKGAMKDPKNRNIPLLATVLAKFWNADMANTLISTGNKYLIEGNNWGDTRCGAKYLNSTPGNVHIYEGSNRLGIMLMLVRELLKKAKAYGKTFAPQNNALEWYRTIRTWDRQTASTRGPLVDCLINHGTRPFQQAKW